MNPGPRPARAKESWTFRTRDLDAAAKRSQREDVLEGTAGAAAGMHSLRASDVPDAAVWTRLGGHAGHHQEPFHAARSPFVQDGHRVALLESRRVFPRS